MASKDIKFIQHIIIFCVILFLLYSLQWLWYPSYQAPAIQHQDICMDYLKEGRLYGGDPYCFQGPFVYILIFLFDFVFRSIPLGINIFYIVRAYPERNK